MPILPHQHDWAATTAGYACLRCSAALSNAEVATYSATPNGGRQVSINDLLNHAWHKAGH